MSNEYESGAHNLVKGNRKVITLSSGSVHYTQSGEGPTIVMLHANCGNAQDFDAITGQLSRSHRVIAIDWPGYGVSPAMNDPESTTLYRIYDLFVEFVEVLALKKFAIIGNSIGGYVAARYAAEHDENVSGLVLVSTAGFSPASWFFSLFCHLQGSRFSIPSILFAQFYIRTRNLHTQQILERARSLQATTLSTLVMRKVWLSFLDPEFDLSEKALGIKQPTLLVFGKKDPVISSSKVSAVAKRSIKHGKVVILNSGHLPFAEVPDEFLETVLPFFKQLAS